jgi:thiosulfate dehydrogenase [quinone] large subunit
MMRRIVLDPRKAGPLAIALLPLRAFLGVTFLYAGIQKLTDPGFFKPHSATYIGTQLAAFARFSPLKGFLISVAVPHAVLFGSLVAWGEVAIGLGALAGALFRPAAFFGALLSLTLWLSATWQVKPYFYGSDIFSLFGWITLAIAGTGGVLALDPVIGEWLAPRLRTLMQPASADRAIAILGMRPAPDTSAPIAPPQPARRTAYAAYARKASRREFLQGATVGAVVALLGAGFWNLIHSGTQSSTPGGASIVPTTGASSASGTATSGGAIANLNSLSPNSAATFTIPSNGDPGVVVRLKSGNVVAFDATCTHAGCPVQYDSGSGDLICPCHGAVFDPAQNAAVLQGPAPTPLTPVAISVNQSTGDITLQ